MLIMQKKSSQTSCGDAEGKKISDYKKLQGFSLANIIMIKINKTTIQDLTFK